jgi:hypothetical protein
LGRNNRAVWWPFEEINIQCPLTPFRRTNEARAAAEYFMLIVDYLKIDGWWLMQIRGVNWMKIPITSGHLHLIYTSTHLALANCPY